MPIAVNRSDELTEIRLDGSVDISVAAELKAQFVEALSSGTALRVGLAGVADLDVTWLQLVMAAERAAMRAGTAFSFSGPVPEKIGAAIRDAGFEAFRCELPGE